MKDKQLDQLNVSRGLAQSSLAASFHPELHPGHDDIHNEESSKLKSPQDVPALDVVLGENGEHVVLESAPDRIISQKVFFCIEGSD